MHVHFGIWACLIGAISLTVALNSNKAIGIENNIEHENNKESNSVYKVNNREQCSKLCDYSSMCGGFTYSVGTPSSVCTLFTKDTMTEPGRAESISSTKDFYFRKNYHKKRPLPSPCDPRSCIENSFCFPVLGTRSFYCLKREIDCGPFELPVTMQYANFMTRPSTTYGAINSVRCIPALYKNNEVVVESTCRSDSTWSPIDLVCLEKYCSPEDIPKGMELTASRNYSLEAVTEVQCRYGWNKTDGQEMVSCLSDETWRVDLKCERVRCPLDVGNGMEIKHFIDSSEPVFEVVVIMACAKGHNTLSGSGISSCQGDGTWKPVSLQCSIKECGSPPIHPNTMGLKYPVNGTVYLSRVYYECTGDYRKYGGEDNIICDATGSWTTLTLDCRLTCRDDPVVPDQAHILGFRPTDSFLDQKIEFACNEWNNYYYNTGGSVSVCKETDDGKLVWSNSNMECVCKCSRPEDTFPGTKFTLNAVTGQVFNVGDKVTYGCPLIVLLTRQAVCKPCGWELEDGLVCELVFGGSPGSPGSEASEN